MGYSNQHRMFLQVFLQHGILDAQLIREIAIQLFQSESVSNIISEINNKLQPLNMTINCVTCEHTGEKHWILASDIYDEIGRFEMAFTAGQLAFLREIFSEIITSEDKCFSSLNCLNLCSQLDIKLSKSEAVEFLTEMVRRKWLYCDDGQFYLGVRTIGELMPYFKRVYENTFRCCHLCRESMFYGQKCPHCQSMLHFHCLKKYESLRQSLQCPNCNSALSLDGQTDNSADVNMTEENISAQDISQPAPSQGRRQRKKAV